MNTHDWALVIFTVLAQMSVGAFVILGIVHFFALRSAGEVEADKMGDWALLAIGPAIILAVLVSFLHLGNPLRAINALANFNESWLSREVVFITAFAVVGFIFAMLQWRKIGSAGLRNLIALVAAVLGVVAVISMAMVYYTLIAVPVWHSLATPISFLVTTLLLGALAIQALFVWNFNTRFSKDEVQLKLLRQTTRWITLLALLMLGVLFVTLPFAALQLASGSPAAQVSAFNLYREFRMLYFLRLALVFLGAGLISLLIYQYMKHSNERSKWVSSLVYLAFAVVLVAEIIGRYLFYASFSRLGV